MTGTRGNEPRIPGQKINMGLRGNLNTSGTIEGPNLQSGTRSIGKENFTYEDLPPPSTQRDNVSGKWTVEKIGSYLGIVLVLISIIIFFYRLDANVDVVKADVKEGNSKIERLDEKANKQTSTIENVTNSVLRLEGEIRRTQDYVHERKK